MADAGTRALHAAPPLSQRVAETPPWSPLRLALAVATSLFALFFAIEAITGRLAIVLGDGTSDWDVEAQTNFRIALVMILLVAYLPAAYAYAARGARDAIGELRPHLRPGVDAAALLANAGRFDRAALRRAGWIGVACAFAIPVWTDRTLEAWSVWHYTVEPIVQRVLLPVVGWIGARLIYAVWTESRRLSQLGRDAVQVDLLDLRSFAPLTRQALRHALLIVGVVSILALYLFDYEKQGLVTVLVIANAVALGAAVTALLLPLRGARQAIAAAKRSELDWCHAEIRRARAALEAGTSTARSLGDLVAWRTFVGSVQEWPLDAPTLRRFLLYLALPLGSWLGGALVERVVDAAL